MRDTRSPVDPSRTLPRFGPAEGAHSKTVYGFIVSYAALAYFNWLEDISDDGWDRNRRSEVDLVFYLTRAGWAWLQAEREHTT